MKWIFRGMDMISDEGGVTALVYATWRMFFLLLILKLKFMCEVYGDWIGWGEWIFISSVADCKQKCSGDFLSPSFGLFSSLERNFCGNSYENYEKLYFPTEMCHKICVYMPSSSFTTAARKINAKRPQICHGNMCVPQ